MKLLTLFSFFLTFNAWALMDAGVYKGLDAEKKECVVEILKSSGKKENVLNQNVLIKSSFFPAENLILRPKLALSNKTQTISYKRAYFEGAKALESSLIAATLDESKREFTFFHNVELVDHRVQTQSLCTGLVLESN